MPSSARDFAFTFLDSVFCGSFGWGRSAGPRRLYYDPSIPSDAELYDKLFDQGQQHLGNLMTVSTLLLGFIVSGTFLAVTLSGHENFDSDQLFNFVTSAGKAALAAVVTLVLSLAVSVRASSGYRNISAQRAHYTLQRSSGYTTVAELCIYLSFYFFCDSLGQFTTMQFCGPDICPVSGKYGRDNTVREVAFCSRLGQDFYAEAEEKCALPAARRLTKAEKDVAIPSPPRQLQEYPSTTYDPIAMANTYDSGHSYYGPPNMDPAGGVLLPEEAQANSDATMCEAYNYLLKNNWTSYQYWFGYSVGYFPAKLMNSTDLLDKARLEIGTSAAQLICGMSKMADAREKSCSYRTGDDSVTDYQRMQCVRAMKAFTQANDCVENTVEDADKCYKVCSKPSSTGATPSVRLAALVATGVEPTKMVFLIFAIFRFIASLAVCGLNTFHQLFDDSPGHHPDDADAESDMAEDMRYRDLETTDMDGEEVEMSSGSARGMFALPAYPSMPPLQRPMQLQANPVAPSYIRPA